LLGWFEGQLQTEEWRLRNVQDGDGVQDRSQLRGRDILVAEYRLLWSQFMIANVFCFTDGSRMRFQQERHRGSSISQTLNAVLVCELMPDVSEMGGDVGVGSG
jgi:hypothetical protein